MKNIDIRVSRMLIALVLASNLYAAFTFIAAPEQYVPGYELQGVVGAVVVRGTGILFLMWNVPAVFALVDPHRNWTSLLQAVIMQAVGLAGESWIRLTLPEEHIVLAGSLERFIWFDAAGLVLLAAAAAMVLRQRKNQILAGSQPV